MFVLFFLSYWSQNPCLKKIYQSLCLLIETQTLCILKYEHSLFHSTFHEKNVHWTAKAYKALTHGLKRQVCWHCSVCWLSCYHATWALAMPCVHAISSVVSDSFVTPWTVAHQAPLPMGFSRQEYWSGLPCPSPGDLPDPGIEPASLIPLHGRRVLDH